MSRMITFAAVAALGIGATGCASAPEHLTATNNPSLYSVHQPILQRTDFVFDVATGGDGVAPAELARLDAWFDSIDLRYGDQVTIDEAAGYESEAARRDVAGVAARYGLLLVDAAAPITAGQVQPGNVRVVVSRTVASVPNCPNWDTPSQPNYNNKTMPNLGCGVNSNLAAMVANPNDLVQGQDGSNSGAATATRAIRSYRQAQPTGQGGLRESSTTGGNNR